MRLRSFLLSSLALVILASGCLDDQIVEELPTLKSVTVEETAVKLTSGGVAELHFIVRDALFRFGGSSDVVLTPTSSQRELGFSLVSVLRSEKEGYYVATLKDNGGSGEYTVEMRLGIRVSPGSSALVLSEPFVVSNAVKVPGALDTGLPVVYIDTKDAVGIHSKTVWTQSVMRMNGSEYTCSVRGRGNTTWEWPKKPYAVKLDKKASFFGMPAHKRWVLLANFMDRTLMRNLVAMKVASLTALDWSPSCQSVELVLDGKHMGTYLFIEQVRVDDDRVAIDEKDGFMLELDFHYDNDNQWIEPLGRCWQRSDGIPFSIKYPESDEITPARVQQIKDYVSEVSRAIYGDYLANPDLGYQKYLDVDSFIDYWIVFEVMGNHELSNPGSVYMHRDKGGKLVAGPVWDFDWGVLSYRTSPQARTGLINSGAIWYAKLFPDPTFHSKLKARFQELLPTLRELPAYMEEMEEKLTVSAGLNFAMWNPAGDATMNNGSIINGDENMSFHNACVLLRNNYEERLQVIEKSL